MRTLLPVLVVFAAMWLDAASANAADCTCDRLSEEGCSEATATIQHVPASPLWCERSDDPRCMPANTHGTSVHTLVPVVMNWVQPVVFDRPPGAGVAMDVAVDGRALPQHSRRIDRPPR